MELFEPKFVYFMWDYSLEGKEGFFADYIDTLVERVNNIRGTVDTQLVFGPCLYGGASFPFSLNDTRYRFFYYDPNYSCKRAYMEGKQIQYKLKDYSEPWIDCFKEPSWYADVDYREKPEEPAVIPEMWTTCIDDEGVVSIMPACEWNKNKGRQLINDTEEECKDYAVENYCKKCIHEVSICCSPRLGCQGFKRPKQEESSIKGCSTCKYKDLSWSCSPCNECIHDDANFYERPMWKQREVKKRRMTNRELAKWVWQGNGQVKHRDGKCTLVACTSYDIREDDKPCSDYYVIRGWDETEWSEPIIEE